MKSECLTRVSKESDDRALAELAKVTFGFDEDFWSWKHKKCPNFDPSSIIVAESEGKLIGTSSWVPRDLKVSSSIIIRAALGGDTAVNPNYRGRGVGSKVLRLMYERLKRSGIVVIYGFAPTEIAKKFYAPLGNILMRDYTTRYTRFLNCNRWRERVSSLTEKDEGLNRKLDKIHVSIQFILNGAPPFVINIRNGKIGLKEIKGREPVDSDVTIKGKLNLLMPFLEGRKGVFEFVKLLARRKIKTRGILPKSMTLFRAFRVVAPAFRRTIE